MSNCVNNMTNEEIWKMLQPKLLKNYIFPNNVSEAVGMAYRVGYLRAMKGRHFKIGEKKKKGGHWEPVDPNNLPKEGTRVRYSRHVDDIGVEPFSDWSKIQIGEETVSMYMGNKFGVKDIHDIYRNSHFIYSAHHPERFDMWVEDNE